MTVECADRAILDAADDLFYARGLAVVTMSDVRDASGVSLRRLYSIYPSKADLVDGWLRDRHATWMRWFVDAVDRLAKRGKSSLVATFDALAEWASEPGYRGCAFLNSIGETSEIDDRHREIVADHKRQLVAHLGSLATRDHPGSSKWLPHAIGVLVDGAIVQSVVFGGVEPIRAARVAAQHLVRSAQ